MDWQRETITLIESYFKGIGIQYKPPATLQLCLIDFMNLRMKLVQPIPRMVFKSTKIKAISIPSQYIKALNYIENKIRSGVDITYHQSKKTLIPSYSDLLLNDWIIQHLHLSDTRSQKGQRFYDRSKYLLFAAFSPNQAFFIDIREHNEANVFAKKEFLKIIDDNWPELLKENTMEDAKMFSNENMSDEDIALARKSGVLLGTTAVNGKILINPGLGVTTSKHSIHVVLRANQVIRHLSETMEQIERDKEHIVESLCQLSGLRITELNLSIQRHDNWPFFDFYENQTSHSIRKNYK